MNKKKILLLILFIFILILATLLKIKSNKIEKFSNNKKNNNYNIDKIVDQIYIINMDKDINRMKELNNKMNNLGLKYKRISGVDGKKIYNKYKHKTKLRPGQLGCLLSHQNVLKDAIKNNYNNILVLEDDVIFHKNFHNEFKKKYKYLIDRENEFDLIYLGCSQSLGGVGQWNSTNLKKEYYDNYSTDGTFAMLINKNLYKPILFYTNKLDIPIDTSISINILKKKKYKCYSFYPHIISSNVGLLSNTDNLKRNLLDYYKVNKLDIKDFDIN